MSYEARTREELSRRALGSLITRSRLDDVNEGSVIDTISKAIGSIASGVEYRLEKIRDAFDFRNATGDELDKRLSEFPLHTITRHPAQRATGEIIVEVEQGLTAPFTIPLGSLFSRSDNGLIYATTEEVTVPAGSNVAALKIEAVQAGIKGNARSNAIDIIEEAPSQITTVSYSPVLSLGREQESDNALKRRALLYLQSLARCQPLAVEYLALSTALPQRLVIADLYEDPRNLGYSILYIEDGSGTLENQRRPGRAHSFTVPQSGVSVFYHEAPATSEVVPAISSNNVLTPLDSSKYVSLPERGIIYLEEGAVTQGDILTVEPYQVYTGPIAEIQSLIEGDPSNPESSGGWRAGGTRIQVRAPETLFLDLDIQVFIEGGLDFSLMEADISEQITAFTSELKTGAPLFNASIVEIVMILEGVQNCKVYETGTFNRFLDTYPPQGTVIRISNLNIFPLES